MIFKTVKEARDHSKSNPSETVECKSYYSDGQLSYHCFYVNGELHGESKSYHRYGQLRKHSFYVNGKPHGELKMYWTDGQLSSHCFYVDGEETNFDHLRDGSYKSLCILSTLFNGNIHDI